ncbi:MAG: hypothetical protein COA42_06520 [Alteromonadaceae bacterium]|nr:MAG: hypothetical protein COA42_06520 [Alteromonadaceae bacterium]
MKSQDIVLLLKLVCLDQAKTDDVSLYSFRKLEADTGISKTELSAGLKRCIDVGLAARDPRSNLPRVNRRALLGFLESGIRYVFPAKPGPLERGVPTSFAAPVTQNKLMSAGDTPLVWPDVTGKTKGQAVSPLYKTVPQAANNDEALYGYLALVDALRLGNPREVAFASELLREKFEK